MNFLNFYQKNTYLKFVFFINSFLVFWYFSNSVVGNKGPSISILALLSIFFIVPVLRSFPEVWKGHKYWVVALGMFGFFHIGYLLLEGVEVSDDYDKPAKAIAVILVFAYLMKYGFSERVVGYAIAVSALACGGYALYEKFFLDLSRAGNLTNPIRYGYLVTTMSMLCLFYAWFAKTSVEKLIFYSVAVVSLVGAFSTGTRGIVVVLVFLLGIFIINRKIAGNVSWKQMALFLGISALSVGIIHNQTDILSDYVDKTAAEIERIDSGNLNTSIGYRLQMWHTALYLGANSFITGAGHDYEVIREKAKGFIEDEGYNPIILTQYGHFHNQYLDSFAKEGILGVFTWCFLLLGAFLGMKTKYKYAVIIILSTMAVGGLTEAVLRSSRLFYLTVLGISIFRCLDYYEAKRMLRQPAQ